MIHVNNVTLHYRIKPVLKGLDLHVRRGELLVLMGPNGIGKSTLLNLIAGVISPQKGSVEIDGLARRSSVENENKIRGITAFLSDHPWLPMSRTGREYLHSVGLLYVEDVGRVMEHSERLLKLFNLDSQADSLISTYSNGQQKKLAIAAVLLTDAKLLILDEPFTGGLDPAGVAVLKRLLKRLADKTDVTIVMATQLSEIAMALASRIALIKDGRIHMIDSPDKIIASQPGAANLEEAVERHLNPEALAGLEKYLRQEEI